MFVKKTEQFLPRRFTLVDRLKADWNRRDVVRHFASSAMSSILDGHGVQRVPQIDDFPHAEILR